MNSFTRDRLAARVKAINTAHEHANALFPILESVFKPLVGCKILKADGTLLKSVKDKIDFITMPNQSSLMVYSSTSKYSLSWTVRATVNIPGGHGTQQGDICLYVGELNGDVLKDLCTDRVRARTDYTVEEIEEARAEHKRYKDLADAALSKVHQFGEYDR